jgi:predicted butyrate kinase (DUF1464 family)
LAVAANEICDIIENKSICTNEVAASETFLLPIIDDAKYLSRGIAPACHPCQNDLGRNG